MSCHLIAWSSRGGNGENGHTLTVTADNAATDDEVKKTVVSILTDLLAVRKGRKLHELTLSDINHAIRSGYSLATNVNISTPAADVMLDKDKVIILGEVTLTVRRELVSRQYSGTLPEGSNSVTLYFAMTFTIGANTTELTNTVIVGGTEKTETVEVLKPGLNVEKTIASVTREGKLLADLTNYRAQVGDVITYQITVSNTGDAAITDKVTVSDSMWGTGKVDTIKVQIDGAESSVSVAGGSCNVVAQDGSAGTVASLEKGAPWICTYNYTVTGDDALAGAVNNAVTVKADNGDEDKDEVNIPVTVVTISPAPITIYTGGDGYDGVVNGSSDSEVGRTSNGLPTPGFYIDLADAVNEKLVKYVQAHDPGNITYTGDNEDHPVVDLSKYLTFAYDDGSEQRLWKLERYDNKSGNDSMAYDRYIYRILPDENTGTAIRLQITDEDGNLTISDDFSVVLDDLYREYTMTIYAGALNQGMVQAELTMGSDKTDYSTEVDEATLTIRGVEKDGNPVNPVQTVAPTGGVVSNITAVINEDYPLYINESQLEVADPTKVALLVDDVVEGSQNTLRSSAVNGFSQITSNHTVEMQYLDLVDTSNGHAYVTTNKGEYIELYWPYPEGTDQNTDFYLVHYEGLKRDNDQALGDGNYTMVLFSEENGNLECTPQGIKFKVDNFSPFALFYETSTGDGGGGGGGGSSDDDDDSPQLNKDDHIAYVSGYPDGTVQPQDNITREEVATIFFRLLTDASRAKYITDYNPYPDVASDRWSFYAITTLTNGDLMLGRPGGVFDPGANITRAEFAVVAAQFSNAKYSGPDKFSDISDHWARDYINRAAAEGWIAGYPAGTCAPARALPRPQVLALVNEVLERAPDADYMLKDMTVWPDNPKSAWYYEDVQEATNSHSYVWRNTQHTIEDWEDFIPMRTFDELVRDAFRAAGR